MIRKSLKKLSVCFILSLFITGITTSIALPEQSSNSKPYNDKSDDYIDTQNDTKSLKSRTPYKKPQRSSAKSLPGIVQEALTHHPSIVADKEAFSATDDLVDQATAGYMPTVDLRASIGRENIRRNFSTNILNPLDSIGEITTTRSDPSFTIRQILFDGMGTSARVARAQSQRHQAKNTLGVTTDTATVDASSAAIDVRRLQRLLNIVNNNIRFHQKMKEKVDEVVQAGAAPISDSYQVAARLQDTFISRTNIMSDLEVATAKFIEVVGKEPPKRIPRIKLPKFLLTETAEMAVRMAMDNNHAIKVARSNVQIAEATARETAAKLVPSLTFEVEGERDRNMSTTSGYQNRFTAMLVARHNLYNGGADLARSRETVKRLTEAHARYNLAIRQTERTIRAAWGECTNARRKSSHLTKLIHEKRRLRDTYLEEFTVGKRTLIDILDAANDVFITEATRTTVDATADINAVVLSVGTGQFKQYVKSSEREDPEEVDENDEMSDPIVDMSYSEPDMFLTPYEPYPTQASEPIQKVSTAKKEPIKRKSIFEQREEAREKEPTDDDAT
jgi:outer membrane protein, adhesin transport system